MRRGIIYLLTFLLLLVVPTGVRYLRFFDLGSVERATPPVYDPVTIEAVPTPSTAEYIDEPEVGQGFVLLDQGHRNNFELEEISYLDARLAARGFEMLPFTGGDLATALRAVTAFLVITPLDAFNIEEIQAVSDFVDRGGRLLLIGDPTRFNVLFDEEDVFDVTFTLETDEIPLNSIGNKFEIIFNGDYLYNTAENEGNFRNIVLKESGFAEDGLIEGIQQLVFYGSHSLQVGAGGESLITADDNTWSSATDRPGNLTLAAISREGQVLALGDIHLLTEPYYTVYDNMQFISHIANFLVEEADRRFVLVDFPYFYRDSVDLVYTGSPELGPDAFDEIVALQDAFRSVDQELLLALEPKREHDTLYLGLYNQAEDVMEILASAGISLMIDPPVLTKEEIQAIEDEAGQVPEEPGEGSTPENGEEVEIIRLIQSDLGNMRMSGTALILLDESDGRRNVIVLAASTDGLENTINRLLDLVPLNADYALADCLLQGNLAICPSNVADEEVEAELDSDGTPEAPEEEIADTGGEEGGEEGTGEELDAVNQGSIGLGETVEGTLAENETHSWTFSDGPATIDIVLSVDSIDAVLELYGPDNQLIDSSDSEFGGDAEQLLEVEIPTDEDYTILASDFFGNSGSYSLTVTLAGEGVGQNGGSIFIFADDNGVPLTSGFTSVDALTEYLSSDYLVTTWVSTQDGSLQNDVLEEYDLVVWDSGDYRDVDGFWGEDSATIVEYAETGGNVFVTGASPTILGNAELGQLTDLEVVGDDSILLDGFSAGDIIELDQVYDAIVTDPLDFVLDEGSVTFLVRGPESEDSGNLAGAALLDEFVSEQRTVILLAPFIALPPDAQETLLSNLMTWFGLSSS